jgi:hypothetical protein
VQHCELQLAGCTGCREHADAHADAHAHAHADAHAHANAHAHAHAHANANANADADGDADADADADTNANADADADANANADAKHAWCHAASHACYVGYLLSKRRAADPDGVHRRVLSLPLRQYSSPGFHKHARLRSL